MRAFGVSRTIAGPSAEAALKNSPSFALTAATVPSNGAMICAFLRRIWAAVTERAAVYTAWRAWATVFASAPR